MSENTRMITQIHNNPREQALLGEFDTALETLSWIAMPPIWSKWHSLWAIQQSQAEREPSKPVNKMRKKKEVW